MPTNEGGASHATIIIAAITTAVIAIAKSSLCVWDVQPITYAGLAAQLLHIANFLASGNDVDHAAGSCQGRSVSRRTCGENTPSRR